MVHVHQNHTHNRRIKRPRNTASKQPRISSSGLIVVGMMLIWLLVLIFALLRTSSAGPSSHHVASVAAAVEQGNLLRINEFAAPNKESSGDQMKISEWDGWQPAIHPFDAKNSDCQSWRQCFTPQHDNCLNACREEELSDDNDPPIMPADWVPDVEILHRMFRKGSDRQGQPWPPPLPQELCETHGVFGEKQGDMNKDLLDAVPISLVKKVPDTHPRILCMVYTVKEAHTKGIRAIRETWAGACHGFLAFSTESDPRIPAISIPHKGKEEYDNMWQKVRSIWKFAASHYAQMFDFFYLGGDDMFVLPQNLQAYLATLPGSPSETHHFVGRRFHGYEKDNFFNSGGAGYVLSQKTLVEYSKVIEEPECGPDIHSPMEDVYTAKCLKRKLGVGLTDTRDDQNRERFHPFAPGTHYTWKPPGPNQPSDWYETYNRDWGIQLREKCCAPDSVSFHYIKKPAMMRHLFKYLYDCPRNGLV